MPGKGTTLMSACLPLLCTLNEATRNSVRGDSVQPAGVFQVSGDGRFRSLSRGGNVRMTRRQSGIGHRRCGNRHRRRLSLIFGDLIDLNLIALAADGEQEQGESGDNDFSRMILHINFWIILSLSLI